ncbi:MAG: hypothetical protein HBSAPP03_17850 [Phycisphaerae bacterium]|nr:MAG: hypothetical protein HBSAPP03_17850 [Phycisphaerae bacterium]
MIRWLRTLRTPSSERFLATRDGRDLASADLHYLPDGIVSGTVVLLEGSGLGEGDVPGLLQQLDDELLPGVDLGSRNLTFTVVVGRVLGDYQAEKPADA